MMTGKKIAEPEEEEVSVRHLLRKNYHLQWKDTARSNFSKETGSLTTLSSLARGLYLNPPG